MAQSVPVQVDPDPTTGSVGDVQEPPAVDADSTSQDPSTDAVKPPGPDQVTSWPEDQASNDPNALQYIPIADIRRNADQPRQHFDEAALKTLADSIASAGLMQPIVVRPLPESEDARFEIVAGERRWRAAGIASLETIPAIVRELDDQQTAEWALIENLQREDLNPIERALAFQRLHDQFSLDHADIASRVGLERSTVTNLLRLLSLSSACQQYVQDGLLAMGHARAIAGVEDHDLQNQIADKTLRDGLSVRKVEQLVKSFQESEHKPNKDGDDTGPPSPAGAAKKAVRTAYLADLEQQLSDQLGTRVRIRPGRKKNSGTLQIDFFTPDQFDDLITKLGINMTGE